MITKDNILTHEERVAFRSMSRYWQEVAKREDTSPLLHELDKVRRMVGVDLLFILARYIELTEEE
jgi:hypothetical protein